MSFKLDETVIGEIADHLDMGMECYYHIPTGTFEFHPDTNDVYFEIEWWQEPIDKIAADRDNYIELHPMSSPDSFRIMEDFARDHPNTDFKNVLMERLRWRKPFRHFMEVIHDSDYRDDWFAYKKKRQMAYVREQLEEELADIHHFQDKMNSGGSGIEEVDDAEETDSEIAPTDEKDVYRKRLISAYQNLLDFKNELFTDALNLAMAGELKDIDSAFEEGDAYTFTIEHLEGSEDINLQKLVALLKQLDAVMGTLANINAIQEEELE